MKTRNPPPPGRGQEIRQPKRNLTVDGAAADIKKPDFVHKADAGRIMAVVIRFQGLRTGEIQRELGYGSRATRYLQARRDITKTLEFLEIGGYIKKTGTRYHPTLKGLAEGDRRC